MASEVVPSEASADPLRVEVVDSEPGFAALGPSWEAVQQDAETTSIFASFDWQYLWWKSYGRGRPLRLLKVTEGARIVGLLALYVDRQGMMKWPVRQLRFVGCGGDTAPDDLGPVMVARRQHEIARALARAILELPDWDVLLLSDMSPQCAFAKAIQEAAGRGLLHCRSGRSERIVYIDLPATHDAWLASLSSNRRYQMRKARKRLYQAHPARFFVWNDASTLDEAVERLAQLHRKRWSRLGEVSHGFRSPEYLAFHKAVMKACLLRDRLRLYCLEVKGEVVAMSYFYRFRDVVYLMQGGFDPDLVDLKPGQVLLGHIIEHAIGEKQRMLDFLRGEHRYKDELATGERETRYLIAVRPRAGGVVFATRRWVLPVVAGIVRRWLERSRAWRAEPRQPGEAPERE